ncbi:universal stress protein [Aurantiacibacter suaedae]|uniref:universal stress protein n=1 Tax=Aurantiacibacter suaedae TaxID=2545755 RepID=UPI0010F665E9|nr:universal stress protein [Aurantiacibacter suaedae]
MRSLLLHAHNDAGFEARLQVALDLARAFDAHLTVLQPIAFNVALPGDAFGIFAAETATYVREQAAEFRQKIEPRLQAEDVRWDWADAVGIAEASLLEYAALADLAIIGTGPIEGDAVGLSPLAGILAVHCRAPILVVSDGRSTMLPGAPAVVAWNGSLEASRALKAALPLLKAAESVTLVSVTSPAAAEAGELPALAGARYLDRHGVACEVVEVQQGQHKVAEVLNEVAQSRGAGLVAMGAYGKPRMIETLFGGVTAGMLRDPKLPLLLAH